MISVIVQRAPGDRQGPDISDPLIVTEAVAVARGTAEIDRNCSDRKQVDGAMPISAWRQPREIVAVTDAEEGVYRGMVTRFARTIDRRRDQLTAEDSITIERVA